MPRIRAQRARDVGDAGRGQRAEQEHIHAERHDAGGHRVFQHVAGEARVLADDDDRPAIRRDAVSPPASREDVGRGAAELQRGLGGDGFEIGDAADAVGAEEFPVVVEGLRGSAIFCP